MPLPEYPANPIPRAFAANGNAALIPDAKPGNGRASWQEGFPTETQLPLNNGGTAPSRADFNGIFKMLSALAVWHQSGGQMVYNSTLNYNVPCVVYHAVENVGRLWWALMPNGPDTVNPGVVVPGTNSKVWLDFWDFLRGGVSGGSLGTSGYLTEFRCFYEQMAPTGWAVRNGHLLADADTSYPDLWAALQLPQNSWKLKTEDAWQSLVTAAGGIGGAPYFVLDTIARTIRLPDTRGDYERCAGGGTMSSVGQWHGDAIRNITGNVPGNDDSAHVTGGAFYNIGRVSQGNTAGPGGHDMNVGMDISLVVPTAAENRTRSFGVLGCVYIGAAAA